MVITRKIEIFVCEADSEMKQNYMRTLYGWRDSIRMAANMIVSHKFVQHNVRDFMYMQEDIISRLLEEEPDRLVKNKKGDKEYVKYNVSDILKNEKGLSEQNTTYRLISSMLKGKVPADMYSCLNQAVCKTYNETSSDLYTGKSSLRSYKNSIPMPFSAKALSNIHEVMEESVNQKTGAMRQVKRYYFTLFGIPFKCMLGQDRSNNAVIIDRCISGEYKMCSSSIGFDKSVDKLTGKKKQKLYLYLCVDIPKQEVNIDKKKVMYAYLGIANPIVCSFDARFEKEFSESGNDTIKILKIGSAEEFLYRRTQIQAALRRCQMNCRYSTGGKGRKRKLQAIERFTEKEKNYVESKVHLYSRMLVDLAVKYHCGTIRLLNQTEREEKAKSDAEKGEPLVLRNWSYFNLKNKIKYKAGMVGIEVNVPKESDDNEEKE